MYIFIGPILSVGSYLSASYLTVIPLKIAKSDIILIIPSFRKVCYNSSPQLDTEYLFYSLPLSSMYM